MTSGHAGLFRIHCSCLKRDVSTLAIQQEIGVIAVYTETEVLSCGNMAICSYMSRNFAHTWQEADWLTIQKKAQ